MDSVQNPDYTNKFDFSNPLNEDTTIYAKISEVEVENEEEIVPEKDETPKTGVENHLGISVIIIIISIAAVIYINKKSNKRIDILSILLYINENELEKKTTL